MIKKLKITVCGDLYTSGVVRDCLKTINLFEIVDPDNISKTDIIYWVYGKGPSITKFLHIWIKKDPLIINHWIGSDVLDEIEKTNHRGINRIYNFIQDCIIRWKLKKGGLINLAGAPWLINELSKLNINATYLPITTIGLHFDIINNQQEKDIDFLSYVPFKRFNFYGGDKILQLARRWPNYKFLVICNDLDQISDDFFKKIPNNVHFSPQVDRIKMSEFYQRSKFFIRYTKHDSESLSVFEALYFRLQVLWTYDFPFTLKIETQEKLSDSIPSLIKNWRPNYSGHEFVIENYSIEKWKVNFLEIIQNKFNLEF